MRILQTIKHLLENEKISSTYDIFSEVFYAKVNVRTLDHSEKLVQSKIFYKKS